MACKRGKRSDPGRTREIIDALFSKNPKAAAAHRLNQCLRASKCGRLCARLVKAPGVADVRCVNIETGAAIPLYEALEHADFHCPEGRF